MLRAAHPWEAELLSALALRSKACWGYSDAFMAACRDELTVSAADIERYPTFVIEHEGQVAGFYTLEPFAEGRVELGHLFLEPAMHGKGLGRRLMDHACAQAHALGFEVLEIQGDPHAAGFYQRCGARQVGERHSASIPGRSLPLFELRL